MFRIKLPKGLLATTLAFGLSFLVQGSVSAQVMTLKSHVVPQIICNDTMLAQSAPEHDATGQVTFYAQLWEQRSGSDKCHFTGDTYARGVFYSNVTVPTETIGAFYKEAGIEVNHAYVTRLNATEGQSVAPHNCAEGDVLQAEATFSGSYPWTGNPIVTPLVSCPTYF